MGYYTTFSLSVINGSEDDRIAVCKAIRDRAGIDLEYDSYEKWYDWQSDMIAVSRELPGLIIQLDGQGEDRGDIWSARYRNGEEEYHDWRVPVFTRVTYKSVNKKIDWMMRSVSTHRLFVGITDFIFKALNVPPEITVEKFRAHLLQSIQEFIATHNK